MLLSAFLSSLVPAALAQTGVTCTAFVANQPPLRQEGATEAGGDILISCSGTLVGAQPGPQTLSLYVNGAAITSRQLYTGSTPASIPTEAALLVNDCTSNSGTSPSGASCVPNGTFLGGNPTQGFLQNSALVFSGFTLPVSGAPFNLRITNVRVNANQIAAGSFVTGTVLATFGIQNQQNLVLGAVESSLGMSVAFPTPSNQQCGQQTSTNTNLTIKELINTAFKSPNVGATNSTPGQWYQNGVNNESQTVLSSTPGWTNQVGAVPGQADAGTRIRLNFINIPSGASVSVPASITSGAGTLVATASGDIGAFVPESGNLTVTLSGSVTYEVRSQSPSAIDSFTIPVSVNSSSSGGSGTILASATYAATTLETTTATPRFADTSVSTPLFNLLSCLPATHLSFSTQPSSGTAGLAIPSVMVQSLDVFGNVTATNPQITLTSTPAAINVTATGLAGVTTFGGLTFGAPGTYTLTASASGVSSAISNSFIIRGPTTVSLSSSSNPARYGQGVMLSATLSPSAATGLVTFYNGATVLGESILSGGQAQLTTALLPSGVDTLYARYGGSPGYSGNLSGKITEIVNTVAATSLLPAVNYNVGTGPQFIAAADLNLDGAPDLVVVDNPAGNIYVLLNNGSGTLLQPVPYPVGNQPIAAAIGDLNGDGKPDLAVVNSMDGTVSILLGKGDGTFQPAVTYGAGSSPFSIAIGDFNNDGFPDLAVANFQGAGTVGLLMGKGDGTFRPVATYPVGNSPTSVAVGDFNGDGSTDLVVANLNGNNLSVLLGNGDGTLQPAVNYNGGTGPISVAVADVNGDGVADLVVADLSGNTASVLIGNGDGSFKPSASYPAGAGPYSITTGDFNGDGKPDLVVADISSGGTSLLLGNGDGTFRPPVTYTTGSSPESVAIADFNGDGRADVAIANYSTHNVSILLGSTVGTYTISGRVTLSGAGLANVAVTLSGPQSGSINTDTSGNYSFSGLISGGSFTVTPALTGYIFSPGSQSYGGLIGNQTANFTASPTGNNVVISGTVSVGGVGRGGVTINVTGSSTTSTTTDSFGNYAIVLLSGGTYTLSPALSGYSFSAPSTFSNLSSNQTANFTGTAATNNCVGLFSTVVNLTCSAMNQGAFQGNPAVSIGAPTTFGAITLVGNVPFSDAAGMAFYNAGGGGGASVSLDLYNTSYNGGIPQAKIKAIDDGNYSDHLTFWTKTSGGPGNALTEKLRITSTGNVGVGTTTPTLGPLQMGSGAFVSAGGVWTNASDRNLKENFVPVAPALVLEKIDALPLTEWNYKSEDPSVRHIGPVAQDFFNIFGVGNSATSISTIDPSGIALAGIQGLDQKIQQRAARLAELKKQLEAKTQELHALQERLAHLELLFEQR